MEGRTTTSLQADNRELNLDSEGRMFVASVVTASRGMRALVSRRGVLQRRLRLSVGARVITTGCAALLFATACSSASDASNAPVTGTSIPTVALSGPSTAPTVAADPRSGGCSPAQPGELREIKDVGEAPYFIRDPLPDRPDAPLVVFLGGGSGRRNSAMRIWTNYLSKARGIDAFRVVLPYTVVEDDYISEAGRTYRIIDELIACYGRPSATHLAGVSNGGLVAFGLAVREPERFDTLLGAPGVLAPMDVAELTGALAGRAVFNGVGALDEGWKQDVRATHETLQAAGVRSVYVEFPNEGHTVGGNFDGTMFVEFWSREASGRAPR